MTQATDVKASFRDLRLVGIAAFASMMSMRACDSILPLLAKEFEVSAGSAAQTISAFSIAYGALQFFYGPLGDRLGKLRVMSVAVALCAIANLLIALSPSLELMSLGRALAGAGGAGIIPFGAGIPEKTRDHVSLIRLNDYEILEQLFRDQKDDLAAVLLEPIMKVVVVTPERFIGDVNGDLNRRRGIFQGADESPAGKVIRAEVPLAEMFGYATSLRSLSQGRATYSMELSRYAEVPPGIAALVAQKN